MNSKIVSFQIVQGYSGSSDSWSPDVVALCADGSLWACSLSEYDTGGERKWTRLTPESNKNVQTFMPEGSSLV